MLRTIPCHFAHCVELNLSSHADKISSGTLYSILMILLQLLDYNILVGLLFFIRGMLIQNRYASLGPTQYKIL